jgi:hypothetical protein
MSYCPPISPATSTRATPGLLKSNSNRYEEATQSKSLFDLEEDLYHLLKIGDEGATACRGGGHFRQLLSLKRVPVNYTFKLEPRRTQG